MASNKRINKAYVRYDGSGRVIAGSLILNRFKPQVGNWSEIPAYECCNPSPAELYFRLLFSNILEVGGIVGDVTDVANWNTYFDLPTYGAPFTSVSVTGDEVKLYGGSNIIIKQSLFDQPDELGLLLLEVDDLAGCIVEVEYDGFGYDQNSGSPYITYINLPNVTVAGDFAFYFAGGDALSPTVINMPLLTTAGEDCFNSCDKLTTLNLPSLITAGDGCFGGCDVITTISLPSLTSCGYGCFSSCANLTTVNLPQLQTVGGACFINSNSLTTISLPACTDLGGTVGNDFVFQPITGNTITLTVPAALMTCNSGNPDGDIQYLQANNTVTIITT